MRVVEEGKDSRMKAKFHLMFRKSNLILMVYKSVFWMLSLLPKKKNLIMFESFNGRQYSDSPRALYEYLSTCEEEYEMVWCADRRFYSQFEGKEIRYVTRFSWKWLWLMPRARYWVTNSRLPFWIPKTNATVYIQTWHGTPLKKLGKDIEQVHMAQEDTDTYHAEFVKEASKWDYLISPNHYSTAIFRRAFGYQGQILETGYPRNDVLTNEIDEWAIKRLKQRNGWPLDKKIILYAPTWRDDLYYEKGKYKFDIPLNLRRMKEVLGDDYMVLLRFHYLVAENIDTSLYGGFVEDCSDYEDIRDLYLVSDILITDYSSVFFDYAILKRPMLFFVDDMEHYRDNLRGFYFDFEKEAPGSLFKNTEDIIKEIQDIGTRDAIVSDKVSSFRKRFTEWEDGRATERVVQEIWKINRTAKED